MRTHLIFPDSGIAIPVDMEPAHARDLVSLENVLASDPLLGPFAGKGKYLVLERECRLGRISSDLRGCGVSAEEKFQILKLGRA